MRGSAAERDYIELRRFPLFLRGSRPPPLTGITLLWTGDTIMQRAGARPSTSPLSMSFVRNCQASMNFHPRDRDDVSPGGLPPSDGTLIDQVRSGRTERFGLLVERYQGALIRTAESRLGRRDWAEEAVQETFLCAFKWLSSYDSRYSFRTWLWTILLNQCRRLYKRRARERDEIPWDSPEASGDATEASSAAPAARESDMPLVRLMAEERRQLLQGLLEQLPEVQADALRLRFFGGLKFQEIADAMECSLSTAKNRVRWGLTRLSEMMQAPAGDVDSSDTRRGAGGR